MSEQAFASDEYRDAFSEITLNGNALTIGQVLDLLNKTADLTRDGWPVALCSTLFCPECGGEVEQHHWGCNCWNCQNPDSFGDIPLPLCYASTTSKPMPNKEWRRVVPAFQQGGS